MLRTWVIVTLEAPANQFSVVRVTVDDGDGPRQLGRLTFKGMVDVVRLWNMIFEMTFLRQQRHGRVGLRLALAMDGDDALLVETVTQIVAAELGVPLDEGVGDPPGEQLELGLVDGAVYVAVDGA